MKNFLLLSVVGSLLLSMQVSHAQDCPSPSLRITGSGIGGCTTGGLDAEIDMNRLLSQISPQEEAESLNSESANEGALSNAQAHLSNFFHRLNLCQEEANKRNKKKGMRYCDNVNLAGEVSLLLHHDKRAQGPYSVTRIISDYQTNDEKEATYVKLDTRLSDISALGVAGFICRKEKKGIFGILGSRKRCYIAGPEDQLALTELADDTIEQNAGNIAVNEDEENFKQGDVEISVTRKSGTQTVRQN